MRGHSVALSCRSLHSCWHQLGMTSEVMYIVVILCVVAS